MPRCHECQRMEVAPDECVERDETGAWPVSVDGMCVLSRDLVPGCIWMDLDVDMDGLYRHPICYGINEKPEVCDFFSKEPPPLGAKDE